MKTVKIIFSAFLLVVLGLVILIPTNAKTGATRNYPYHYYYPYPLPVIDNFIKDAGLIGSDEIDNSIRIPSISEIFGN